MTYYRSIFFEDLIYTATVFEDLREIEPFSLACTPRLDTLITLLFPSIFILIIFFCNIFSCCRFWNVFQAKFRQALLLEITQSGATTETDISAVREKVIFSLLPFNLLSFPLSPLPHLSSLPSHPPHLPLFGFSPADIIIR